MTNLVWSEYSRTWTDPSHAYPGADLRLYPGGPQLFPGDSPGVVNPGLMGGSTLAAQNPAILNASPGGGFPVGALFLVLAVGAIVAVVW